MKKGILFLCQYFYPDQNSSATLPFDTAKHLAAIGYKVGALVGYPKEYSTNIDVPMEEIIDGVAVKRVKYFQAGRVKKIGRLINFFSFTFTILLHGRDMKDYETVVVYSNPPILPIVAVWAKKKYGTKIIFVAYDVYPEIAYASDTLHPNSITSKAMNHINKNLFKKVDMVVALTDEMKSFLLKNRPDLYADRIVTIPNWAHEEKVDLRSEMYEKLGYNENQFIVSYFGNMGTCQDMDTLMDAIEGLKNNEDIKFLIVGHGNKKEGIKKRIEEQKLDNVKLMDFLTGDDFKEAVAISSSYVVSLEKGLKGMCAPSKYYSYLQGGKPILSIVEEESYLHKEVKEEAIGFSVQNGDAQGLITAIKVLHANREMSRKYGASAKRLSEEKYAYKRAMEKYEEAIKHICANTD